jgi:predicted aspartyl protease
VIGVADPTDYYNLGLICNTTGRWKCSEEAFAKLLAQDKGNNVALANLAIAQTHLGKYSSAVENFERLTNRAQGTYDTMAAYGRAEEGLGHGDDAIGWYYRSLAVNPRVLDVADRLIDLLVERKQYSEAFSVIGNLSYMTPQIDEIFKGRMIALAELEQKNGDPKAHAIRLVSIRDHHFLPIALEGMKKPALFMVDTGASELIVSRSFLAENGLGDYTVQGNGIATLADGHAVFAKRVLFHRLRVGPWLLKNVSAVVCEGCAPLAGQSLLKRFQMSTRNHGGVEYMTLRR